MAAAQSSATERTSNARKEQEMAEIRTAQARIKDEIVQIDTALKDFNTAKEATSQIRYVDDFSSLLVAVKSKLAAMKTKKDEQVQSDRDLLEFAGATRKLIEAYEFDGILGPPETVLQLNSADRHYRVRFGQKSFITDLMSEAGVTSPPSMNSPQLSKVDALLKRADLKLNFDTQNWEYGSSPPAKWSDMGTAVSDAEMEIDGLEKSADQALERWRTDARAAFQKAIGFLGAAKTSRVVQDKDLEKKYDDLDKQILQAETDDAGVDKLLTYAVYGMVAAILFMFIALTRWTEKDLATLLVEKRTMIELLSMGFLLLTVIILGTGKKLTGEALGALLGTIAGYIFGRREGEREGERKGAQEERQVMSAQIIKAAEERVAAGAQPVIAVPEHQPSKPPEGT